MTVLLEKRIYTETELSLLNPKKMPRHVAIIMDGNRRWAKKHALSCCKGHGQGAENLAAILRGAAETGVKILTLYAFSTENWKRSNEEVQILMNLFYRYLINKKEEMVKNGVRLRCIGDLSRCPEKVQKVFYEVKELTKDCDRIDLVLAVNYGGRDEIVRAAKKLLKDCEAGLVQADRLDEKLFASYLDTAALPDPDLLIRTSGEMRISNFLLWQLSYTELFTSPVLWPDFSKKEFLQALLEYQQRTRRRGGNEEE